MDKPRWGKRSSFSFYPPKTRGRCRNDGSLVTYTEQPGSCKYLHIQVYLGPAGERAAGFARVGRSPVPDSPNRMSWEEEGRGGDSLEKATIHTPCDGPPISGLGGSISQVSISSAGLPPTCFCFFLCSPSPSVYQLSNCCCWISPVGVNCPPPPPFANTPRRYISHTILPHTSWLETTITSTHSFFSTRHSMGRGKMDEAAAERIRKARGEKVSSPARLPRVSSLFTPLPGRVCPASIHCRAAKQGGKRHRQGQPSTRGEQWRRQRRREARRRRREVRQAVGRGISECFGSAHGYQYGLGGFFSRMDGRRSAGQDMGRAGFACLLVAFESPGVGGISGS